MKRGGGERKNRHISVISPRNYRLVGLSEVSKSLYTVRTVTGSVFTQTIYRGSSVSPRLTPLTLEDSSTVNH